MNSVNSDSLLIVLIISLVSLAVWILYLLTLKGLLQEINPENRRIRIGQIWLLLIPLFNMIWYPLVVHRLSQSVREEFHDRGWRWKRRIPGELAAYLSYASVVLFVFFGKIFLPVVLVSGIIHWLQTYNIKSRLEGFRDIL
jgi:hypothetical protein